MYDLAKQRAVAIAPYVIGTTFELDVRGHRNATFRKTAEKDAGIGKMHHHVVHQHAGLANVSRLIFGCTSSRNFAAVPACP